MKTQGTEALQYSRSLIEASLDPLVILNMDGQIADANEAAVRVTGVGREGLIGTDFCQYFTEPHKARKGYEQVLEKGSVADYTLTLKHQDGSLTDVVYVVSVYLDGTGNVAGVFAVVRNANQALARQIEEKEQQIAELTRANAELRFQNQANAKRIEELTQANAELTFQNQANAKRAEELATVLRKTDHIYRKLIDNLPVAVYTCDKEGYVQLFNKASAELWGREPVIGVEMWCGSFQISHLDGVNVPLDSCPMAIALKEERATDKIEVLVKRPNGEARNVLPNPKPLFDEDGKCIGAINTLIDITEIRKSQQALSDSEKLHAKYSRGLIEASKDPLVTISPEGKIMDMNEAMVESVKKSRAELVGTDFSEYFTDPHSAHKIYQQVFEMGFVKDYPLTLKEGALTDVLFNGSIYKDVQGKVVGAVVVARDITEQNKIAKELLEAKLKAEMNVVIAEEAKAEAERATIKAKEAVKAKQQFLSNMSHEIRTPMNAIIGFTKVVLKTDLSAQQREYLNAIKLSGDALIVLINDILDLAKVDAGKMTFEKTPFKLAASVSSMLHLFDSKIQEKNLLLEIDYDPNIPEILVGDPVRLHQIIMNLLSNAIKFTGKGKISIGVHLLKSNDKDVVVEFKVIDTGIGISESKIGHIFENFQQASSSTSRLYGGTGLGLAISKQLVEQQGGSIRVVSNEGEGSMFTFTLPFQKTELVHPVEAEEVEIVQDVKCMRVLVAEDIPLNQLLMRTLLDDFGFESDIVSNGRIAIEKLQSKSYDVILMDLQMPEMNGFEATEYIRNTLHLDIPILALTADVTTADVAKCKAVGMNDYLAKPVDERILYTKIIALTKKTLPAKVILGTGDPVVAGKYIDMTYLNRRTKSNPQLMMEMIALYLEHTPPLITSMRQSFQDNDWELLRAVVHKLIPSFLIMGISTDFEKMAKTIQDYAIAQQRSEGIQELVSKVESVCLQACDELEVEFNRIKNAAR